MAHSKITFRSGSSLVAMGLAMLAMEPSAAFAQTTAQPDTTAAGAPQSVAPADAGQAASNAPGQDTAAAPATDEDASPADIVVVGSRQSLKTSQGIKRNAETVVDSLSATDIGALPDKSVAESLQRVPGVTVSRFSAPSDTSHFAAEPSGVIVRGLPQVRSEYNGRDSFSAGGNGLSWSDITPELMTGIDVYKNMTADMIEGGIAGLVNLRTRVPFDAKGATFAFSLQGNYGSLIKKGAPEVSGLYSNRWQTGAGEFGVMVNLAYSNVKNASQGAQLFATSIFDNVFPGAPATTYIPSGVYLRDSQYERNRLGVAGALQWRSNDGRVQALFQYNRSKYDSSQYERAFVGRVFDASKDPKHRYSPADPGAWAAPGTQFTFDDDGNFLSGTFNKFNQWRGGGDDIATWGLNSLGEPMFTACYDWNGCPSRGLSGVKFGSETTASNGSSMTQDFGFNMKFEATDRLSFNVDAQFIDSNTRDSGDSFAFSSYSNLNLDVSGGTPVVGFAPPTAINQSPGGVNNPNNYYPDSYLEHLSEKTGQEWAFRGDVEYKFESDWLNSLRVGVRYSDRNQTILDAGYVYGAIANEFSNNVSGYWNLDSKPYNDGTTNFTGYPEGFYQMQPLGTSFLGQIGTFPFVPQSFMRAHRAGELSKALIGVGAVVPICQRPDNLPDSCYRQQDTGTVGEETRAAYAMLRFGGPNALVGGLAISGNIGLRYVETRDTAAGSQVYPTLYSGDTNANNCPPVPLVPGGPTGTASPTVPQPGQPPAAAFPSYCYLGPADVNFSNGGHTESVVHAMHRDFLPSFNLRVDLSPKWLVRFAASKAMSRPGLDQLRNNTGFGMFLPSGSNLNDPQWIKDSAGNLIGVTPEYTGGGNNPNLKPMTAWQFDLSIENYFANVGSFSLAVFYKSFQNYIQGGTFATTLTNNGVTRDVLLNTPANGKGAKIQGAEVAYQRYFTFLPKPLDGLGMQANFTYIENKGVPNASLSTGGLSNVIATKDNTLDPGTLEGLSKYSYNLVGFYDKGPIGLRVAYNWRSQYLVTVGDCCVGRPVWQKAQGWMDASIRYAIRPNVELNLSGSNLLNSKTVTLQQVTDRNSPEGKIILIKNATFANDVRVSAGVRIRFGK